MSLGCSRCGDCCDPVGLSASTVRRFDEIMDVLTDAYGPGADLPGDDWPFIVEHWHEIARHNTGQADYRCDRFDPELRACTAYDDRPPVCRDFPWYSDVIKDGHTLRDKRCSFLLDVPPDMRPEGARPLIPIEVITR